MPFRLLPNHRALGLLMGLGVLTAPFLASAQTPDSPPEISVETDQATPAETPDSNQKTAAILERRRQQTEARLREMLRRFGVTTLESQDAILAYLAADEKGRAQVRDVARQLSNAIRKAAPPERIQILNTDYKNAIERDRVRRDTARVALNAQIGYSFDPLIEAMLLLSGILGDGPSGVNLGTLVPVQVQSAPPKPFFGPNNGNPRTFVRPNTMGAVARFSIQGTANYVAVPHWDLGIVTAKGDQNEGENWIEIRTETGRDERLWPQWIGGAGGTFAGDISKLIAQTPLGTRVRYSTQNGRERQFLLRLEAGDDAQNAPITPPTALYPNTKETPPENAAVPEPLENQGTPN